MAILSLWLGTWSAEAGSCNLPDGSRVTVSISGPSYIAAGQSATYTLASTRAASTYRWQVPEGLTITSGQGTRTLEVSAAQTPSEALNDKTIRCSVYGSGWSCSDSRSATVVKVEFEHGEIRERNLRTLSGDDYPTYTKSIPLPWVGGKGAELKPYLKIIPSAVSYDQLKSALKWTKDGTEMSSSKLSYSDENLNVGQIFPHGIGIGLHTLDPLDELVVVIYPSTTRTAFEQWANNNGDRSWLAELPPVYASLGPNSSDPEPFWDGDLNPFDQRWGGPKFIFPTYYHHDAAYAMRSEMTPGGHGHQACYDARGGLIEVGVAAGSADYVYANGLGALNHVDSDVLPFVWAAQLDGNPVEYAGLNMTHPLLHEGDYLGLYLEYRPSRTENPLPPENASE